MLLQSLIVLSGVMSFIVIAMHYLSRRYVSTWIALVSVTFLLFYTFGYFLGYDSVVINRVHHPNPNESLSADAFILGCLLFLALTPILANYLAQRFKVPLSVSYFVALVVFTCLVFISGLLIIVMMPLELIVFLMLLSSFHERKITH